MIWLYEALTLLKNLKGLCPMPFMFPPFSFGMIVELQLLVEIP